MSPETGSLRANLAAYSSKPLDLSQSTKSAYFMFLPRLSIENYRRGWRLEFTLFLKFSSMLTFATWKTYCLFDRFDRFHNKRTTVYLQRVSELKPPSFFLISKLLRHSTVAHFKNNSQNPFPSGRSSNRIYEYKCDWRSKRKIGDTRIHEHHPFLQKFLFTNYHPVIK